MTITACPKCGSRRIFQGRLRDGVLTGYTSKEVCRDCGYRGSPFIFDSIKEYNNFLRQLKKENTPDELGVDSDFSEKDKQVLEDLKDIQNELKNEPEVKKSSYKSIIFVFFILIICIAAGMIGNRFIFADIFVTIGFVILVSMLIIVISVVYSRYLFRR